jgi:hypothetical protein
VLTVPIPAAEVEAVPIAAADPVEEVEVPTAAADPAEEEVPTAAAADPAEVPLAAEEEGVAAATVSQAQSQP